MQPSVKTRLTRTPVSAGRFRNWLQRACVVLLVVPMVLVSCGEDDAEDDPKLWVSTQQIDFQRGLWSAQFVVMNQGGGTIQGQIDSTIVDISAPSFTLAAGVDHVVTVTVKPAVREITAEIAKGEILVSAGSAGHATIRVTVGQGQSPDDTDQANGLDGGTMRVNTAGLLALWLCDDGAGKTVKDASRNGMDARFMNGGGKWVQGKFGGGIEFQQQGWVDTDAPVVVDTRGFTMGCWIKPGDTQKAFANIMSSHQEPPRRGISFEQSNLDLNVYGVAIGTGEEWTGCGDYGFQMDTGKWQHMTVVRSEDGKTASSYVDGEPVLVNGKCAQDNEVVDATSPFRLGNWVLGDREWNGVIDEAFVLDRPLDAGEVKSLYEDGWRRSLALDVSSQSGLATAWAAMKARIGSPRPGQQRFLGRRATERQTPPHDDMAAAQVAVARAPRSPIGR